MLQFYVTPSNQNVNLYTGQSQPLSFTVNNPTSGSLICSYSGAAGSGSLTTVLPSSSQTFSVTVQAPVQARSETQSGQVTCLDSYNQSATQPFSVSATYIQNPAIPAIDSATTTINDATSAINSADSLISTQTSSCVDTTSAQNSIQQAKSQLTTAQTNLQNAKNAYTAAPYDTNAAQTAVSSANSASSNAQQAKNLAVQASSTLQSILSGIEQKKQSANGSLADAKGTIDDAISSISTTDSDLTTVSNLGADVTNASALQKQARDALSSAQTDYGTGISKFNSCAFDQVLISASSAKTNAGQAKTYSTQAYNSAENARSILQQLTQQVSDLLKLKQSNINSAQSWIDRAVSLSNNQTLIGIDLVDPETKIKSAQAELDNAKTYYSQAQDAFNANRYALAQQNKTGEPQLNSAQTEISKAEQLYNKLSSLVADMQNYTNLSDTNDAIQKEKDNLNSAKDLLSKAQNAYSSGSGSNTINFAVDSRNTAATSYNRLDDIISKLSESVLASLNAQVDVETKNKATAQQKITDASATFGASADKVISAEAKLKQSKEQLNTAQKIITNAKNDNDLLDQLDKSKQAFEQIKAAGQTTVSSIQAADGARLDAYAKVGGTGALGIGLIGGGFMWWRRKKDGISIPAPKTKVQSPKDLAPNEKITKKEPHNSEIGPGQKVLPEEKINKNVSSNEESIEVQVDKKKGRGS
ncbi:hypothetical protein HZC07_02625 [Candidatus Micrarchaeota archaeon]|nr:hypothetical protein [Candidatus Micrarchaeota archaeon]